MVHSYCFQDGRHNAVIALNNLAVSLLARRQYGDALETLRDALHLIEASTVESTITAGIRPTTGPSMTPERVEQVLQRANMRSSFDGTQKGNSNNGPLPPLQVISSQSSPAIVYKALTSCVDSATLEVAFPVTIDPLPCETYGCSDIYLHIGVIWCNFGIAHTCLTSIYAEVYHELVLTEAHRIFQRARSWFMHSDVDGWERTPVSLAFQLLSVRTILTHSLINVSGHLNLDAEYSEYCRDMTGLLHSVEAQQVYLPMTDHWLASAA